MIGLWCAGISLRALKRYEESIAVLERAVDLMPEAQYLQCELGASYAEAGDRERAEGILRTLVEQRSDRYVSPFWRAVLTLGLGRVNETLELLDHAYYEGAPTLPFLGAPWWTRLRGDPRFAALARRIGLPVSIAEVV
jgi:tetratricopeptide (TPR) repeat protein